MARLAKSRRAASIKKYLIILTCVVVAISVAVTILFAQPWATGSVPARSLPYLGIHEPDTPGSYYDIDQFAQAIGRQPNLVSYYSLWSEPFQTEFATSAEAHGAMTLVQLDPMIGSQDVSLASIAGGQYDTYLRSYATAVKNFRDDVILSFGHEMNGNWYSWGYQHTPPEVFVAAWQHIVRVFRSVGAENVIWLWTINVLNNSQATPIPGPSPWWPGSRYVTWVGIDGYYYNSSAVFSSLFGPTIVAVRALTHDPILIAETGAAVSAGQAAKVNDLFEGVRSYGLLGFVWFDENTQGRDWRISSSQALSAFGEDAKAFLKPPPASSASAAQHPPSGPPSLLAASGFRTGR
jgi:mannan endo-1,4-beta-mannosidase